MAIAIPQLSEAQGDNIDPQFAAFLEAAIDAVFLIDAGGCIQTLNCAAERMFGYSKAELAGNAAAVLIPAHYRRRQQLYLSRYLRRRQARPSGVHELIAQRRDGSPFAAEVAISQVPGICAPHLIVFVRDISERKRNEEALRHSEAALHVAQELVNIGNYVINFDGGPDYASPQLLRIFGWDPDESVNGLAEYVRAIVHPADRHRVEQAFTHLYTQGGTFHIEYRVVHAQAGLRYLHHIAQAIHGADDRVLQHVGTVHDITERRTTEHEIRQMQDRIAHFGRISTMGEMAASIAHEVNQPLAAIATFAQSCERLLASGNFVQEELATSLKQIASQALRAGQIVRRMRDFSKRRPMHIEAIKANRLMEELLVLALADAHHHAVRISFAAAPESPSVRVDTVQIQQVLLNLVHNGIEAMMDVPEAKRELLLRTQLVHGEVEFIVDDRGRGLDPRIKDEMFQPFVTTKYSGTGLGLAISASIVRAHGGKLQCENNVHGGARFSFSLPAMAQND